MASSSGKSSKTRGLLEAAFNGNLRRVKKFATELDDGKGIAKRIANIKDSSGLSALHLAAFSGKTDICNYLISDLKLDVDIRGVKEDETPLLLASIVGNLSTAMYLLKKNANPELTNDKGLAPLHCAAEMGHEGLTHLLLSRGANVDAISSLGTPLQRAALHGKHDVVKILLDHHANPNLSYDHSFTPISVSITAHFVRCVELLLEAGADPNAGVLGMTPLVLATSEGQTDMLGCLLKAGADPNVTNEDGLAPIEIAAQGGNHQAVQILFRVTSPIQKYPDWSFGGIHSEEAIQQREIKEKEKLGKAKSRAQDAFRGMHYGLAIYYYTMAVIADPSDATLLSSRSLCFAFLKDGETALSDAMDCITMKPDWPEAYYRAGAAWNLLEKFDLAAAAFSDGLKLDPENIELQTAYQEAVEARLNSMNVNQ